MSKKRIAVLGATGSIGKNALDVVARHPDRFEITALAARADVDTLFKQVEQFRPGLVAMADPQAADTLTKRLRKEGMETAVRSGPEGVREVAASACDLVIAAIVGGAGMLPTFDAVEAGTPVALANKESLVMAGPLLMGLAERRGVPVIPVDSEHSAIFQCLAGNRRQDLSHIILTASGGPFRALSPEALTRVTPEQAGNHPNWDMGAKITVDSATLMNKGLEVIEARWLFGLGADQVQVVVHPQSIIHSMVAFQDGGVMAQMGLPDMRGPIAYAMSYPERVELDIPAPDFAQLAKLTFEPPDTERFPCLDLAFQATRACGTLPTTLNAANEVAVAAFLDGRILFTDIPRVVASTMAAHPSEPLTSVDQVLAADHTARAFARAQLTQEAVS
ncbi:MAG: 1-deoxy-D-xylulose-5-phosphate reductoisomerase [Leptospirillia bacterium]